MIIKREIEKVIKNYVDKYPVLAVTGPRQSGKTTLLKYLFPDYEYVSLEKPDVRNFAETDPNGFLKRFPGKVIFDEIQRIPALFSYLQTITDESRQMGQFILSGSQNFHLMQSITQSLSGRVAIFRLFPFDFRELESAGLLKENYEENLLRGFYPAIYDRDIPFGNYYSNYVQTYLHCDISELISIRDSNAFHNFLGLCAARAGQMLNLNALALECGISQPTARSWFSALETSYICFLLQPYFRNFSKRIVKTPKLYFYDTGLLCHLLKIRNSNQITLHSYKGNLFENMMVAEYVKRMNHSDKLTDIWFWRDSSGNEVDFLVEEGTSFKVYEFKSGETIMPDMFSSLSRFAAVSGMADLSKTLVYAGSENQDRSAGNVLTWKDFGR